MYICWLRPASRHNGVQFFISHLASWLRTRRFSEPTFQPSRATNHWKNIVFRDFATFSRTCIFFLLTFSLLWSSLFCSSLLWLSSHLCFSICPYCRKFGFLNFLRQYIYIYIYTHSEPQKDAETSFLRMLGRWCFTLSFQMYNCSFGWGETIFGIVSTTINYFWVFLKLGAFPNWSGLSWCFTSSWP